MQGISCPLQIGVNWYTVWLLDQKRNFLGLISNWISKLYEKEFLEIRKHCRRHNGPKSCVLLPKQLPITTLKGNPQDCQPQNWLLVANPEVGNSEYVHYSGLPTPIMQRISGYNAPQPTFISTITTAFFTPSLWMWLHDLKWGLQRKPRR